MHDTRHIESTELNLFLNKGREPVWGVGLFAAILMSVSGWVEDFIKAFGAPELCWEGDFPLISGLCEWRGRGLTLHQGIFIFPAG